MAIPESYTTTAQYVEDVLTFIKDHQWIYNFPNTHILVNKVLDSIPSDWISYLNQLKNTELNNLALGVVTNDDEIPPSLSKFISKFNTLKPNVKSFIEYNAANTKNSRVGIKKLHEINSFAPLIKSVCEKSNIGIVVDVGAGLGYLSQILFERYAYKVIGIEGSGEKIQLAENHQARYYKNSIGSVKYVEHYITESSGEVIKAIAQQTYPESFGRGDVCIAGLHACADLSVTILDIFLELDCAKSLAIMPCCYHRLEVKESKCGEIFVNFPSSEIINEVYKRLEGWHFLKKYFMRLACQQSAGAWTKMCGDQHDIQAKNCLFRAVLQVVSEEENWKITRLKRKSGKSQNASVFDVDELVANLNVTHAFTSNDGRDLQVDESILLPKILKKWDQHRNDLNLIGSILAFQTAIQGICENIVLLDRVEYLREKGVESYACKVTDDCLSPRCFAIVASK